MNKKQLEQIREHCKEIRKLIESDTTGTTFLLKDFEMFYDALIDQLKTEVWQEYNK